MIARQRRRVWLVRQRRRPRGVAVDRPGGARLLHRVDVGELRGPGEVQADEHVGQRGHVQVDRIADHLAAGRKGDRALAAIEAQPAIAGRHDGRGITCRIGGERDARGAHGERRKAVVVREPDAHASAAGADVHALAQGQVIDRRRAFDRLAIGIPLRPAVAAGDPHVVRGHRLPPTGDPMRCRGFRLRCGHVQRQARGQPGDPRGRTTASSVAMGVWHACDLG